MMMSIQLALLEDPSAGIQTKVATECRGISSGSSIYYICGVRNEDANHVLITCLFGNSVWS
ncbi:hypothetical protein HanHA300_Chr12g0453401 [Helianthus annuus]|nr:hypothetical protein HanHA300_Chr12g0453401 [Helianthus annuus]KAJ0506175.1 hypothetical protein HanHA89_Chr12g0478981 [Helianthus annuus]KAJ0675847.1 hypothetical protein HanLR1_Chr12g0455891 [Helianthus annuus]KAJ0679099.1 hypothetical protein HanOQP8_Chr12g0455501 [Helianthus annuus]